MSDSSNMISDNQSESQETTSTSVLEENLNISFEDLVYTVREGILAGGRKTILNSLSGSFNAGELSVIMGQSGAGKSTLMDILAGYTKPTNGRIYVNGRLRNYKNFRRRSCYILQDDQVQSKLTIQESLTIAADLKLGDHVNRDQRKRRVQEILTSLTLDKAKDTQAGNLSGGQRKRLAIGLELVSDPPIMFLDEPTSGLDSSTSKQIVYLLHLLARQGRTLVVTMHQPSAALIDMVDRLYTVVGGRCAYMGSVHNLEPFLQKMDLTCPPFHNRVDFLIESCSEKASALVKNSENGKSTQWSTSNTEKTDNLIADRLKDNDSSLRNNCLTILPAPREDDTSKILLKLKSTYSTSFWKQFIILTKRSLLSMWRDRSYTYMITGIHCAMALFMGVLFYNIGLEGKFVRDNYSFLQMSLMFTMFTSFSSMSILFPEQLPAVRREHFNRWYMTGAYYTSTLISVIPTQFICTLCFTCITFWMTGQPNEFNRFIRYYWTLSLTSFTALCIGLLNGSMFTVKNGVVFGPLMIMPFTIFSGFFLSYVDAPFYFKWMFHISFLKHGLVGIVLSIYGMDRPKLPCSDLYCHYTYPKQLLSDVGVMHEKYYEAILALFAIIFIVIFCAYIILKIRLRSKW